MKLARLIGASVAVLCLSATAHAQINWVSYSKDNSKVSGINANQISNSTNETDIEWADLDLDGWTDVIIVRKQPFTSTGKRTNLLFMNVNGTLTNQTSAFATDADVGGDNGFNTATNDRDVIADDFDQDGWLDFITATTLSDGDPKHIGHPRIYMNKGASDSAGQNWQGMRFENSRMPQFKHFGTGNNQNPRFCSVDTGDVTGNGYPDAYFGDYDSSGAGGAGQGSNEDLNDRLIINNGNAVFSDGSQARMTSQMLASAFGNSVDINDFNLDGVNDIMKDTSLNAPQYVAVSYNNPNNEGFFNLFDAFSTLAPYHISTGDLNNDGRLDVVISDDGSDRWRTNDSNDGLGRVNWSSAHTFNASGGDDGFASNNGIVDIDRDGWADVYICDVDVDIGGCSRRLHIYKNNGSGTSFTEQSGGGDISAQGLDSGDLGGMHDLACADFDRDGDMDLLLSDCGATDYWTNTKGNSWATYTYGLADDSLNGGLAHMSFEGQPVPGGNFKIVVEGANPNSFFALLTGTGSRETNWLPAPYGNIYVSNTFRTYGNTDSEGRGEISVNVTVGMSGNWEYHQFLLRDPGGNDGNLQTSDALAVRYGN